MAKAINSNSYVSKPKKRGLAAKTQTSKKNNIGGKDDK